MALGYVFEFSRVSNNLIFKDDNTISKNIIVLNIKNTIGVIVYSIRMNETECIRLMDVITMYMFDFYDLGNECRIHLSISNNGKIPILHFHNIDERYINNPNYNDPHFSEYRSHILSIYEADMNDQNSYTQILSIPLGDTEVSDFVFNLYFNGLIDLVFPAEVEERLDIIMGRIFGDNWHNFD